MEKTALRCWRCNELFLTGKKHKCKMETKKQAKSDGMKCFEMMKKAISNPSFVKKDEVIPVVRTEDHWATVIIMFKRKVTYIYPLSLQAYSEYKRLAKEWWK